MNSIPIRSLSRWATGLLFVMLLPLGSAAQTYRNIVNTRFRTVSNGPQSAVIVDVKNPNDAAEVRRAVTDKVGKLYESRRETMQRELQFLRQKGIIKNGESLALADAAIIRSNGKLILPDNHTRAANRTMRSPSRFQQAATARGHRKPPPIWQHSRISSTPNSGIMCTGIPCGAATSRCEISTRASAKWTRFSVRCS